MESRKAEEVGVLAEPDRRVVGVDAVPLGSGDEGGVADEPVDEDRDQNDRWRNQKKRSQRVPREMAKGATSYRRPLPRCGARRGDRHVIPYLRNWSASFAMFDALALTFFFCTNWPISSLSPLANASGAAEPCAMLGVSDAFLNSPMNLWAMESKRLAGTSVRAGIEPFLGLKAACPSLEPHTLTQLSALSWSRAPLGTPNVSHTIM